MSLDPFRGKLINAPFPNGQGDKMASLRDDFYCFLAHLEQSCATAEPLGLHPAIARNKWKIFIDLS